MGTIQYFKCFDGKEYSANPASESCQLVKGSAEIMEEGRPGAVC